MPEWVDGPLRADEEPTLGDAPIVAGQPVADDEPVLAEPAGRTGCRTELHGWAGAHLHGAVRPRRRAAGRGRPPGRWC